MALHHSLRDLVSVRGPGVVEEAEEFRGVLDDFLAEDEATLGELNLLVDAVRLGALRRVLDVMSNGAAPQAAIREAGAGLARDRGTDDPTRSCWALASLCFALGKVDEAMVRLFLGDTGTMSAPGRPTAPGGPAPDPSVPRRGTAERPMTEVLPAGAPGPVGSSAPTSVPGPAADPTYSPPPPPTAPPFGGPVPPVIREKRSSRAGVYLLVVLVALLLGGLVATGIILLRSDDDEPTAGDNPSDGRTGDGRTDGQGEPPLIADSEMLVPYKVGEETKVYAVDVGGSFREITAGPFDALPTVSPDRRTLTYGEGPAPFVQIRWDIETASFEPFFPDTGPCAHALRPGWSLDGERVAVVCTGDDELPDGIYVAGADGSDPQLVVEDALVRGAPSWVSDNEFIYGRQDDESDDSPLTFWRGYADGRTPVQLDVDLEGLQLTHIDWSPEAEKLLFLVSPRGEPEVGDVWIMDVDGSNPELVADGLYAHPVWSTDGKSIGLTVVDLEAETEVLGYVDVDDPDAPEAEPHIVENPPPGEVGIPVWGTR